MSWNNINTLFVSFLLSFFITNCSSNSSKGDSMSGIIKKDIVEDTIQNKEESKTIKQESDESLFVQRIIDGNFFQEKKSEEQDYALVVTHCFSHTDEQYDETFADGLSQMLVKYPDKFKGIQKAISLLPVERQSEANYNMMVYIASSWIMDNCTDTIDLNMFYQTYPFLKKSHKIDSILKKQFENSVK